VDQIARISATAPPFRKLWLSGGEPFMREELADIVAMFVRNNGVGNINLPTNGLLPEKIFRTVDGLLEQCSELSIDLNFSLDAAHRFTLSRRPLAQAGEVRALVYRDLNDNGVHDASEPYEKDAIVTTGIQQAEKPTGMDGTAIVGGLTPYQPIAVGIDVTSLADPMLVPKKALQVVVPRPGVPAEVQIGLVGGGDIEGALVKGGGAGFEGVDLEIVDASGKVVGKTRTDYDGFFLFERIAYGSYTIRVANDSARAAKISSDLGVHFVVGPENSVIRLGTIRPIAIPQIAAATFPTAQSLR
jgi:hypothetical protein